MIIIIDNYDSFTYNLYQSIAQHYPDVRVFRNDKITVDEIQKLKPTGIILSPGPGRPQNAGVCIAAVQRLASYIPILGVCLGHQAIAKAFGGNVIQAHEIVHGKTGYIFHYRNNLFHNMPLPFKAGRYHSLIVEKKSLPKPLKIIAENENGLIMAIKHKKYSCYGIQFHPESVLTPQGDRFLMNFLDLCQTESYRLAAC